MTKFNVDISVPSDSIKLFELATDFENFSRFSPAQIKKISIIEQSDKETVTNEILAFNTIFKNVEIKQKTRHLVDYPKTITSEVIEGPFKKTGLQISFSGTETQTKISVKADVKIGLKYAVLSPIIGKLYKGIVTGLIYKMNNAIMNDKKI